MQKKQRFLQDSTHVQNTDSSSKARCPRLRPALFFFDTSQLVAGASAPSYRLPVRRLLVSEAGEKGCDDPAGLGHEVVDVLRRRFFAEALLEQSTEVGQESVHFAVNRRARLVDWAKGCVCGWRDSRGIDADLRKGGHGGVELVADGNEDVAHVALGDLGIAPHLQRRLHASTGVEQRGDGGGYVTDSANLSQKAQSVSGTRHGAQKH